MASPLKGRKAKCLSRAGLTAERVLEARRTVLQLTGRWDRALETARRCLSLAEALGEAALAVHGRAIHVPATR